MQTRRLGRSGLQVSALGIGTARIGGLGWQPESSGDLHWTPADVTAAIHAIHRALDLGITFFDTADIYGCGHSERVVGQALRGRRHQAVLATKFGHTFQDDPCQDTGADASPRHVRRACEASLRRLDTDYIDLYLLHLRDYDLERAGDTREALEDLVTAGKIRFYGWSTDDVERARLFAQGPHCTAVEHRFNIVMDNPEMLALCDEHDLASINRIPLLMGVLSGSLTLGAHLPEDDRRREFYRDPGFLKFLERVERLHPVLERDGRTLAQAALGWIWTRSPRTVPIPGVRTLEHVEQNAQALELGPLGPEQMAEIDALLEREST
jgi:aryl-alcohol dehydrogenase-like predicted oxidoreductase